MMASMQEVYETLLNAFGPQWWWPSESPFETMVGAILVQNTAWKNVVQAIDNVKEAGVLSPTALYKLPIEELETLLKPAGYFRRKSARLRNLLKVIVEECDGDVELFLAQSSGALRERLLTINGIGPETADAILLYAAKKPAFVIDSYTYRMLSRHGWIDFETDYEAMRNLFVSELPPDVELFNEFHALIVQLGKEYCKKRPQCEGCPLEEMLPESGMRVPFE